MDKIQILIEKLWKGTISPEEAGILDNAIKNVNDDERNKVKNHFRKLYEQDTVANQTNKNAAMILANIMASIDNKETNQPKRLSAGPGYFWWAAAAIIGICSLVLFQRSNHTVEKTDHKIVNQIHKIKVIENKQERSMNIALPDGSEITLFPGSKISYNEGFNKKDRMIDLKGKAVFKVAKDKKRPFTVVSEGFATTALGTKFMISKTKGELVEVKLLEGRVRVRDTSSRGTNIPDIYLEPGQLVTLNKLSTKYEISTFKLDKTTSPGGTKIMRSGVETVNGSLNFNNVPLNAVLQKLSEKYKTTIDYRKATVEGLYFTGTVEPSDSLRTVLFIITNMNGLKLNDLEGKLVITR